MFYFNDHTLQVLKYTRNNKLLTVNNKITLHYKFLTWSK